jgi:diguanylate cyclase (GGDEF)-like protein
MAFLTVMLVKWVNLPLGTLAQCLQKEDPSLVAGLEKDRTEFGAMARLIAKFFRQRAELAKENEERRALEERLNYLAYHDYLTGLPNRMLFHDRLTQAVKLAERNKEHVAVLFIDLDHFKEVNDTLGHETGDVLLQAAASRLSGLTRKSDTISRMGGDEFTMILPELKHPLDARIVAERVIEVFSTAFQVNARSLGVTASIGLAVFPADGTDVETLMKNADIAMYRAKNGGRNTFRFFAAEGYDPLPPPAAV